jgi:penicillin-binding protein 1A
MPQLAEVLDMDGNLYSRLHGENRIVVPLDKVSPYFINALVAREDTRFYKHGGVDPRGIARAILRNVTRGKVAEGASTLTQQLARNSLPLGGRTFRRKVLEAFVANRIEHKFSKAQILEFYINRI